MRKKMLLLKFPVVSGIFLLNSLLTFASGDTQVFCELKQSCILPCNFPRGNEVVVHWIQTTTEKLQVHSYYHNQDQLGNQHQRFRGRTSLYKDQIFNGNASLRLSGVEIQDEGRYQCYTSTISGNQESFIRLNVEAPVQKVNITEVENRLVCSSEGIYPEPKLTWSTTPLTPLDNQPQSEVQQNRGLYSISSSLVPSDSVVAYSCTISTQKKRTATWFKPTSISGPDSEITISCTDSNTPLTGLSWKFNHSEVILSQSKAGEPYTASEKWKQYVKGLSETGTLTLQNLSSDQEGIYTCELTNVEETVIKNIFYQISEGNSKVKIIVGVLVPIFVIALLLLVLGLYWRKRTQHQRRKTLEAQKQSINKPLTENSDST